MSLLVIHPPTISVESLRRLFLQSGCSVTPCANPEAASGLLERHPFKGIFLVHPQSYAEFASWHAKVKKFALPTFVITRRQSGVDRVNALREGVSNYFIEPFSYTQVVRDAVEAVYGAKRDDDARDYGDISVDFLARTIVFEGAELFLSKTQFLLFTLMLRHERQVFSRVQIWEHVWGYADYPLTNTIDVHIRRLRKRLPKAVAMRIEAVHGVGYRYVNPESAAAMPQASARKLHAAPQLS